MKKFIILIILCLLIVGCRNKKEEVKEIDVNKIINKIDVNKDYVYSNNFKYLFLLDGSEYNMSMPIINLNSDDASNINLEIKNEFNNKYKNYVLNGNVLSNGYIMDSNYYINDNVISIVISFSYYLNGIIGEKYDNTYNLSINDGKLLNKAEILDIYNINDDDIYDYIKKNNNSIDIDYIIMNVRNNGYQVFINDDNKLVIIYYEISDDDSIRKELVIN